jgi:hypothetical protein
MVNHYTMDLWMVITIVALLGLGVNETRIRY